MLIENEKDNLDSLDTQVSGDPDDNVDLEALVFGSDEPEAAAAPVAQEPVDGGRTIKDATADYVERERAEYQQRLERMEASMQAMQNQTAAANARAAALEAAMNRPQTLMQPQAPLTQEQLVELFERNPQAFVAATARPMLAQEINRLNAEHNNALSGIAATNDIMLRELATSKFQAGIDSAKMEVDRRCETMGLPREFAERAREEVLNLIGSVGQNYTDMDAGGKVVKNLRFNEIVDRAFGALASEMVTSMRASGRSRMAGKAANVLSMPVGADRTGYGLSANQEPSIEARLLSRQRRNKTA